MTMDGNVAMQFDLPQKKASGIPVTDHGRELQANEEADLLAGRGIFGEGAVVMVYGTNCGHCTAMAPEFKAATEVNGGLMMVAINASKFPNVLKTFGITGIPKIFQIEGGKMVREFTGARKKADLLEFAKSGVKKTIPSSPFQ
jgi:thiol-disulfide isomerase/thioredoxin